MVAATRLIVLVTLCLFGGGAAAYAQTAQDATTNEGWSISAYPVLVWVPFGIEIDVDIPPDDGDDGGSGSILESRFDGAFFGGLTASNGVWRIEGYGIWAAFGGDRLETPLLAVDLDLLYGEGKIGRRIAPEFYVTGGVRRVALKYDISLGDLPSLSRKPGVWDPLVGVGWHRVREKLEWHAAVDVGGFGAGSDLDVGGGFRLDWKPVRHFGFAAGYNFLYLKLSDDKAGRTVTVEPTVHGPTVGIGLYF
jgi:hypothetical protein